MAGGLARTEQINALPYGVTMAEVRSLGDPRRVALVGFSCATALEQCLLAT